MGYDKVINWLVTDICNFNCEYCIYHGKTIEFKKVDVDKLMRSLGETNDIYKITLSGGEPFLVPNIMELIKAVTQKHHLVIVTNFSSPKIIEFFNSINPENITVCISVHFHELEKRKLFDRFIRNYQHGIEKGFNLLPRIVGYPGYIPNLDRYLKILNDNNIKYFFTSFSGTYNGKNYPESYTPEEIALFNLTENDLSMWASYHKPCPAGSKIAVSDSSGNLYSCYEFMFSPKNLNSNLFESVKFPYNKLLLCPFENCGCPFYLYEKGFLDGVSLDPKDCVNVDHKIRMIKFNKYLDDKKNSALRRLKKAYKLLSNKN